MTPRETIDAACSGWSTSTHWSFFQSIIESKAVRNVCVCGVYFGRDIAYLASIFQALGVRDYHITGVDLFSDAPGADWPEDKHGLTWEQAFGIPHPSLAQTTSNLESLALMEHVTLVKDFDYHFLETTQETFDFIYLDTAHDYQTVKKGIDAAIPRLTTTSLIGGDDFSDSATWGVESAVKHSFTEHHVVTPCWISSGTLYIR